MKVKQFILKLLSSMLIVVFVMATSAVQITSIAMESSVNLSLQIKHNRYLKGEEKRGYAYNSDKKHPFFQILEQNNDSVSGYYCLNATVSQTWNQTGTIQEGQAVTYSKSYNMETELEQIKQSQDSNYKKLAESSHLNQVMWILRNMYVPTGNENTDKTQREALLSAAGITYSDIEINSLDSIYGNGQSRIEHAYKYTPKAGYDDYVTQRADGLSREGKAKEGWYYDNEEGTFTSVLLPDEMIEVAQQAAIWYYTNYLDATEDSNKDQFDVKTKGLQLLSSTEKNETYPNWTPMVQNDQVETDVKDFKADIGAWEQDQATILCWYLIDAAEKNATTQSTTITEAPLKITIPADTNVENFKGLKVNEESCYVVGPIQMDKVNEAVYTLSDTITVNNKECTNYYVLSTDSETTSTNKTISDEVGKEIYLAIPADWVKTNNATGATDTNSLELEIKFNGTYKTSEITLYEASTTGEQAIAKVVPKNGPFTLTVKAVDPREVDLALTKFIVAISEDAKIDDGEYITKDGHIGSKTNPYLRATAVDTTELRDNPTCHDATYTRVKTPLTVPSESYVLYDIRVYNEGDVDVYAGEVKDHLPEYLEFVDCEFNDKYGWELAEDKVTVTTKYLEYKEGQTTNLLKAFNKTGTDDGKGSELDYRDLQILCKVKTTAPENTKMINTAEISKYQDKDGNPIEKDVDSEPDNRKEKNTEKREQDDDDWEVVIIRHNVDLALTKFITAVSQDVTIDDGEYVTADGHIGSKTNPYLRATGVDTTELRDDPTCHDAKYNMVKEPPLTVASQSYVLYNIRVYNEGDEDIYAGEVTDHLPEYLNYVECDFNTKYRWKVSGEDGKTITTDYLSYEQGAEDNLIKKFDRESDDGAGSGLDYRDLQVLCRVSDKAPTNTKLVNIAEVTKYQDENGDEIDKDVDSTPDNVDQENEDDDDYEQVIIQNFDLSLLKWVSTVYVTEDGKTKTIQTGNTGDDSKDVIPKVEINRKKIDSTIVRFGYTIKVTNEGDVEGYVKEITDYVPEGLKFYSEDNNGWTDEGNNVISTRLLENTLLKPGESAEVTVILRWINGSDNLNAKTNVAEISEDYNDKGIPDKDSTPDNKKQGEDDIDDATVLLAISTGIIRDFLKITLITIAGLGLIALFGAEYAIIRKYVL